MRVKRITTVMLALSLVAGGLLVGGPAAHAKKKKKPPPPPPPVCEPFVPGEAGAEAENLVVTDSVTAEAPLVQPVTLEASTANYNPAADPSIVYLNIQVDTAAVDTGLYAHIDFPERRDYDLNLLHTDGSYAARSRAVNTFIELTDSGIPFSPGGISGHGGHSTASSEELVGIRTSDCGGWTLAVENWMDPQGGEREVKIWLGEVQNEPQAPGEET